MGSSFLFLKALLQIYKRVDIVFDIYLPKSLKDEVRKSRGDGEKRRVRLSTKMPRNYQSFLRVNDNKTELNQLVASEVNNMDCPQGTLIVSTRGAQVLCSSDLESIDMIMPCDHEEADTRTMLHAAHMKQQGTDSVVVRTNGTDVLILATYIQALLGFNEFRLSIGVGRSPYLFMTLFSRLEDLQP